MIMPFAAVVLAAQMVVSVADKVPDLKFEPNCRAAARADISKSGQTAETCMRDETDARDQLGKQWARFRSDDREHCTTLATTGGNASYVELLTCLEMAQAARNNAPDAGTTGTGSPRN
ncbi:MAG: hypothetical protein HY659_11380 [Rhizobiales bacterium]|nr:hypothetical protein [Hyphomicrobiales bacterium]